MQRSNIFVDVTEVVMSRNRSGIWKVWKSPLLDVVRSAHPRMRSCRKRAGACICLVLALYGASASAAPFAYIPNSDEGSVDVIDTATNTAVARIAVGGFLVGVAVNRAGTRVYVASQYNNTVSVIDTATNTLIATIARGSPYGIAVNPAGTRVYVTSYEDGTLSVIDSATQSIVAEIPGLGLALAINPAGTRVYVAGGGYSNVSVVDTATNTLVGEPIPVGGFVYSIAVNPAGTRVYVVNSFASTVSTIDTATNTVVGAPIAVGSGASNLAINPAGTRVYVSNFGGDTVSVIDTASNSVVGTQIRVGSFPYGIAVNPAGTRVYVANSGDNTVSVIDTATNTVVGAPIVVGARPFAIGQFIGPPTDYSRDTVQKAYVAYYGRPADPVGQDYWASRMDAEGQSLNAIVAAFGDSDEFIRHYGVGGPMDLLTEIYQQTLARAPDPGGLAYYLGELAAGRRTLQSIALDVLYGATTPPDSTVVANRLAVAAYYTAKVVAGCGYGTEQDGIDSLSGVRDDIATVTAARAAIASRCGP
jgi:YVTN family beta-propeller protein